MAWFDVRSLPIIGFLFLEINRHFEFLNSVLESALIQKQFTTEEGRVG